MDKPHLYTHSRIRLEDCTVDKRKQKQVIECICEGNNCNSISIIQNQTPQAPETHTVDMGKEIATPVILYRNLQSKPFIPYDDPMTKAKECEIWLEGIEREFRFFDITNDQDKVDALIIYGGTEIARLEKSQPDQEGNGNKYTKLKTKLNDYFLPKKNKHYARYKFLSTKPQQNESILSYATEQDLRIYEHR